MATEHGHRTNTWLSVKFLWFFVSLFRLSYEISLIKNCLFDCLLLCLFVYRSVRDKSNLSLVNVFFFCLSFSLLFGVFFLILTCLNFHLFLSLALFYGPEEMPSPALEKHLKNYLYKFY